MTGVAMDPGGGSRHLWQLSCYAEPSASRKQHEHPNCPPAKKKKKHKTTRLQTRSISIPSIAGSLVALFLANLRPVKSAPNLSHLSPILRDLRNPVPYPNQKQVRDLDVSPSPSHVPDVKDLKTLPYNTVTTLSSFVVGWVSRYIDP